MKKDLKTCFSPGDIIRVRYSTFTHYGVVSDRTGEDGMPMIIDNSYASGTAVERTWAEATVGKVPSLSKIGSEYPRLRETANWPINPLFADPLQL